MMPPKRHLIVNADDFGQSSGVNRGVIAAHERGIVTSASLMVRWPAAAEAAAYSRGHPNLSLGLHFDLGEWICRDKTWVPLYEVVPTHDTAAVASELAEQLAVFGRLVGRDPTHIDSHQHVHRWEPVHSVLVEAAHKHAIPLRRYSPEIHYCGDFYGQTGTGEPLPEAISIDRLINILAALPPGITELGCHPGEGNDLISMYRDQRTEELKALCDPQVRATIVAEGIELRSFHTINFHSVDPTLALLGYNEPGGD
jgi:chitin disaccharide deacetylase